MPALIGPRLRRSPHRFGLLLAAATIAVIGSTACASDTQAAEDAYKVGCPALDAAMAGGSVVNRAALTALESVRDSGQLDPEPQQWVEAAIGVLTSSDSGEISADAKKLLIDGCAEHGYPLENLN